jgi:hypothetical protein
LPSILHDCHFDTISSFSIKNFFPDFLIRPHINRFQVPCKPVLILLLKCQRRFCAVALDVCNCNFNLGSVCVYIYIYMHTLPNIYIYIYIYTNV